MTSTSHCSSAADPRRASRPGSRASVLTPSLICLALFVSSVGCTVGDGEGEVVGTFNVPSCELDGELDLAPSFFAADDIESGVLEIRLQSGSDFESKSDGVAISVLDPAQVASDLLSSPLSVGPDERVEMSVYLNDTCGPILRGTTPVHFTAAQGTIVFDRIFNPDSDDEAEIAGRFEGVELIADHHDEARTGRVDGSFRFIYTRGRPAQRFP